MQEEHKFENSILEQQQKETRTRKQIEIEEVDSRGSNEYEQKLQSSLQELRDAYEQQMAENKAGFSAVYDKKIQDQGRTEGNGQFWVIKVPRGTLLQTRSCC